ncbi:MAG: hypothetical protein IT374_26440 [Polyangiaceae bacterium]|nr:hypothetical protein [Polyangiaceae bacterium]
MTRCGDIARRLGIHERSVRRACERGDVPATRNADGAWVVDDGYAAELRPEDVLRRQVVASPRALMLAALDAVMHAERHLAAGEADAAAREVRRARLDLEVATGAKPRPDRSRP